MNGIAKNQKRLRLSTIVLPREHGGWGFLIEPILLGLLVAPSVAGLCYALAVAATFLSRHPARMAFTHRREVLHSQRYRIAAIGATAYLVAAAVSLACAIRVGGSRPLVPLLLASPFAFVFATYDLRNRVHSMVPEIVGPLGLAATASVLAVAGGRPWSLAFALWLLLIARGLTSIFYVRARLRLERGQTIGRLASVGLHVAFAGIIAVLIWQGLAPVLTALAFLLLVLRAGLGLSRHRRLTRTRHIGILEIVMGLTYVAIVAAGYAFDL